MILLIALILAGLLAVLLDLKRLPNLLGPFTGAFFYLLHQPDRLQGR